MKYAIIAAGEGSRLSQEGVNEPKPLVKVNGEHLIDRLIRVFMSLDAEEIVVICNDLTTLVSSHLAEIQEKGLYGKRVPLRYIVKSTPSSMHSFYELSSYLEDSPFVLTTVDTIFHEEEFAAYVQAFQQQIGKVDGLMGVTDYVEDEKPLYVGTDEAMNVTGFYDVDEHCKYISG
ncbi:MAG: NTP transferase domain-containing protein, partial [Prevotella sp.]|nr:NTP transferase domain-containing protein [Prevotella sp.]